MRCPKCQYLGFDGQDRCRNCGYDFSLSQTLPSPDDVVLGAAAPGATAIAEPGEPADDLPLRAEPTARERARAAIQKRQAARGGAGPEAFDLPLFAGAAAEPAPEPRAEARPPLPRQESRPFVSVSPTPRPPLSVRRATTEPPRSRAGVTPAPAEIAAPGEIGPGPANPASAVPPADPGFDIDALPMSLASPEITELEMAAAAPPTTRIESVTGAADATNTGDAIDASESPESSRLATIGARLIAGSIDAGILAAIDLIVIAFTLRLTNVAWSDISRLPLVPLGAFLALLAIGYLAMFTVLAGQTAGKMITGIRVVETNGRPVRFGHAVLRAALQVLTVPLLGLGFLPALLAADRRALYDRLSETEVVRETSPDA